MPTRRQLLAAAAAIAGASLTGAGALAWSWWDQAPGTPYATLSADEVAVLDAIAEACFPAGGDPALGGREAGIARYFDGVMQALVPSQRKLMKLGLHALDTLPVATHGSHFSALPTAAASALLGDWLQSGIAEVRGVAQSFTIFVSMAYFAHPAVTPRIAHLYRCGVPDPRGLAGRLG